MADNDGFATVASPFGQVTAEGIGLLAPLAPDVALLHAAVADAEGNLAVSEPLLEGVWGAWAARRGVVATVERVVDSLDGLGHRVRIPAHRVLAVVEAPFGAHPGGCYAGGLPVAGYGEDIPFWSAAAEAAPRRLRRLRPHLRPGPCRTTGPTSTSSGPTGWPRSAPGPTPPAGSGRRRPPGARREPPSRWEVAAALAAREVVDTVERVGADAVLAGAGVANLAAWVAVGRARAAGRAVQLTAELGLWGYHPTPADPYIFNHRVFPSTPMLSDASTVLGMVVGGPGTTVVGCLGAAEVDRHGNLNSTAPGRGPVPGRLGRGQRRGQPGRGLRGGDPGPPRAPAGRGGLHHLTGPRRDQRGHRPRRPAASRRRPAGGRRPRRGGFGGRAGAAPWSQPAAGIPSRPGRWRSWTRSTSGRCWPCASTTANGCFLG